MADIANFDQLDLRLMELKSLPLAPVRDGFSADLSGDRSEDDVHGADAFLSVLEAVGGAKKVADIAADDGSLRQTDDKLGLAPEVNPSDQKPSDEERSSPENLIERTGVETADWRALRRTENPEHAAERSKASAVAGKHSQTLKRDDGMHSAFSILPGRHDHQQPRTKLTEPLLASAIATPAKRLSAGQDLERVPVDLQPEPQRHGQDRKSADAPSSQATITTPPSDTIRRTIIGLGVRSEFRSSAQTNEYATKEGIGEIPVRHSRQPEAAIDTPLQKLVVPRPETRSGSDRNGEQKQLNPVPGLVETQPPVLGINPGAAKSSGNHKALTRDLEPIPQDRFIRPDGDAAKVSVPTANDALKPALQPNPASGSPENHLVDVGSDELRHQRDQRTPPTEKVQKSTESQHSFEPLGDRPQPNLISATPVENGLQVSAPPELEVEPHVSATQIEGKFRASSPQPALQQAQSTAIGHFARQPFVQSVQTQADGSFFIRLNPEELGPVRLTFSGNEGAMIVQIVTERADTMDLMRRHLDAFASDLRREGFQNFSFSFGSSGGQSKQDDARAETPPDTAISEDASSPAQLHQAPVNGRLDVRL